nr:hypothetical protein [Tanacetum cinerariifolium]
MRMAVVSGVTTAAKMVAVVVVRGRKKGGDSGSLSGVGWCRSVEDDDGVEMVDLGVKKIGQPWSTAINGDQTCWKPSNLAGSI